MTEIRVLRTREEKAVTRALYEQVFPEDSARFLDWYYLDRCVTVVLNCLNLCNNTRTSLKYSYWN